MGALLDVTYGRQVLIEFGAVLAAERSALAFCIAKHGVEHAAPTIQALTLHRDATRFDAEQTVEHGLGILLRRQRDAVAGERQRVAVVGLAGAAADGQL